MIDPRAASGFTSAADYARGRPGYPDEAWDVLCRELELGVGSVVVDLAAGTGQVTRALRGRVAEVVAVEPVAEMRAEFGARLPGVTVLDGTAEALPVATASADAVVVGEAFHWFDVPAATREIARVLRPGGGLALLWNVATWTEENTPWLCGFRALVAHHREAAGGYPAGDGRWRHHVESSGLFDDLRELSVEHRQCLTADGFAAQVASWSWVAGLPEAIRGRLLSDVEDLVSDQDEVTVPFRTEVHWTRYRNRDST